MLHPPVVVTQENEVAGISEVGHMGVGSNINPWIILHGLARNERQHILFERRSEPEDTESPPYSMIFV